MRWGAIGCFMLCRKLEAPEVGQQESPESAAYSQGDVVAMGGWRSQEALCFIAHLRHCANAACHGSSSFLRSFQFANGFILMIAKPTKIPGKRFMVAGALEGQKLHVPEI